MKSVLRVVVPGALAAIVVGLCVGFLAFTYAPPVGGPGVAVYVRVAAGTVAGLIAAWVVWFLTILIAQAKGFAEFTGAVDDGDEDPFDDPFFDR